MSNAPLERLSAAESAACVRGSGTCAQRCSWFSQKSSTTPRVVLTCRRKSGWSRTQPDGESQEAGDGELPALPAPRADAFISW